MGKIRKYRFLSLFMSCAFLLAACSSSDIDDYATNKGYEESKEAADNGKGIPKTR